MAIGYGRILFSGLLTTTAPTTVYAAARGTGIAHGTLCNTSALAVSVSVSVLKQGDTADGTHLAISNYSLAAGDTLSLKDYLGGALLAVGESIAVTASAANAVTAVISGWFA